MPVSTILLSLLAIILVGWLLYRDWKHQSQINELKAWKQEAQEDINTLQGWKVEAQPCIEDLYKRQVQLKARVGRHRQELTAMTASRVWYLQYDRIIPLEKRIKEVELVIDANPFAKLAAVDSAIKSVREYKEPKDLKAMLKLLFGAHDEGRGVCKEKIAQRISGICDLVRNGLVGLSEDLKDDLGKLKNEVNFESQPVRESPASELSP